METPLLLQVEIRDRIGRQYLKHPIYNDDELLARSLKVHLSQDMGGILCMVHYNLPEFETALIHQRYVVRIRCCCAVQLNTCKKRVKSILKNDQ